MTPYPELRGTHVCLEPLEKRHVHGLSLASAVDPALYRWSPVPQGEAETVKYIETALDWRDNGTAVPFAIIRLSDAAIIGSTRFWNLEKWAWPAGHPRHGRDMPDACEIGYTWLTKSALRTAANTETKLLMLTFAFESWHVLRVCFHADVRNQRSRDALERLGTRFEGILRSHRMAADYLPRDSARYSIVAAEWPQVGSRLQTILNTGK